jgi:hypothetical protein
MGRLFAPWTDTAFRIALVAIVVGGALAITAPFVYMRTPYHDNREFPVDQPVQFDHRHHVKDDRIDCRFCHSGAEKSAYAGIPSTDVCMGCHSQVWNDSPMLEPVRRSYFSGEPLAWNRVHRVPDFVYFNHAAHVNKGVGCVSCHGRVDEMALAYPVAPLTMSWCLDCHRDPAPNLRPRTEIANMAWQRPATGEAGLEYGRKLARELGVRSLTHCTACHR